MHHCLHISEILENTFAQFDTSDWNSNGSSSRDLAALARTCRTFSDVALDALWLEPRSMNAIIKCLPPTAWSESSFHSSGKFPQIRPLTEEDWKTAEKYISRVQSLRLDVDESAVGFPPKETLTAIACCFPRGTMFPNLRKLWWKPHPWWEVFTLLHLFVGPRMTSLEIRIDSAGIRWLPTQLISMTNLENLRLWAISRGRLGEPIRPVSSSLVKHLSQIQTLQLPSIDASAFRALSDGDLGIISLPGDPRPFPTLHFLALSGGGTQVHDFAVSLIRAIPELWLRRIQVFPSNEAPLGDTLSRLYSTIAFHVSPATLEHIEMGDAGYLGGRPNPGTVLDYVVRGAALRPLFRFTNLTFVFLETCVGFDIDDEVMWDLAAAWPNLEELSLRSGSPRAQVPSRATLDALRALAKYCPHMHALLLPVDATEVPSVDLILSPQQTLDTQALNLCISRIGDSEAGAVAEYLMILFPNLSILETERLRT
ncbi:hypothetical protein C8F01DRAFT_988477 [Mycena amicta]|nr:hypothetical protein C8F01DRAFT_988477 [Mycena amicta]